MSLGSSFVPNYYSIEDILTTQERVPCKILQNVPNLGKLDVSSEAKDLAAGIELELPLWLIQLSTTERSVPIISPSLPKIYKETYREILKADASVIELQKFNLHFFELGRYVRKYDPQDQVKYCLEQTFQKRFRQIMHLSERNFVGPEIIDKMDLFERRLFHDAHEARLKLSTWLNESRVPIKAGEMVMNHKKRKRVDMRIPR